VKVSLFSQYTEIAMLVTANIVSSSLKSLKENVNLYPYVVTLMSEHFLAIRSVRRLLVTASVVPSSPILVTLMKEVLSFSETSVLARAIWRNIPEDATLNSNLLVLLDWKWIYFNYKGRNGDTKIFSTGKNFRGL
jgi:hypothetical protein